MKSIVSGLNNNLNGISASNNIGTGDHTATVNISVNANFEIANLMDDVGESDHLIAIVDNITADEPANGISYESSKIAYVASSWFSDGNMASTATHEVGHNLGLIEHPQDKTNYMSVPRSPQRNSLSFSQLSQVVSNAGKLNQGSNYSRAETGTKNLLWNSSSNLKPYDFNVNPGQKIPRIVK